MTAKSAKHAKLPDKATISRIEVPVSLVCRWPLLRLRFLRHQGLHGPSSANAAAVIPISRSAHFCSMRSGTALLVGVLGCTMDRQMVLDHLALAERHIAEDKIAIERQQTLIAELEQGGHDTTMSRQLLSQFFHSQKMHEEHRNRLRRDLAKLDAEKPRSSS
jgi:hypothetical protein